MANHSKYDPKFIRLAGWLARDGKKNDEIASALDITRDTFQQWLKKYPELKESVSKGKDEYDNKVVDSLFKRAIGYDYIKTEIEVYIGSDGKEHQKKKTTTMHVPADVLAINSWLNNRQNKIWKRNPDLHLLNAMTGGQIDIFMEEVKKEANKFSSIST